MKTLLLTLFVAMLLFSGPGSISAQDTRTDAAALPPLGANTNAPLRNALLNYATGLRSDNCGLVESCLYYAVQLRVHNPEMDLSVLEKEIDALVAGGKTLSIRRKAALASILFVSPSLAILPSATEGKDIDAFFAALNEQVTAKLVVMK
ncbi:MAG: hypothetical protein M5R41_02215 [Bacteroidia bacterium]|nr:hypothetical protein [Bacteroidia bacterium]